MSTYVLPDPKTQKLPVAENIYKGLILIGLLFGSFYLADGTAKWADASTLPAAAAFLIKWGVIVVLGLINCTLLTGLGVLAHEGIHRIFCRSPFWNEFFGGVFSAFPIIPFYANRQFHLTHHSYTHQQGNDPEEVMHNHSFWYAATIGALVAFKEQYRLMLNNLLKINEWKYFSRGLKDVALMGFILWLYFWFVPSLGLSIWYTVVPTLALIMPIFTLRAISDHYGLPSVNRAKRNREEVYEADKQHWDKEVKQRSKELSSWIIITYPWVDWLWSHIHYHEVHHRYPYISHIYLRKIFEDTRGKEPYYVVHGYFRSMLNQMGRTYYGQPGDKPPLPDPYS